MAILSGLGIALALFMARHRQDRPRAIDLAAAAAGAASHTIPTRPVSASETPFREGPVAATEVR
jgi:hypothetical protein